MKLLLSIGFFLTFSMAISQEFVGEFNKVRPDSTFDNIHVHQISSNIHSTTFAIWVKQKVKIHKHVNHVENIYVSEGSGIFQLEDSTFNINPGDLIVVPKNKLNTTLNP